MSVKIEIGKVIGALGAMRVVAQRPAPVGAALKIARALNELQKEIDVYMGRLRAIQEAHKDEKEKIEAEIKVLDATEVEINITPVALGELGDAPLSPGTVMNLEGWMINTEGHA